ncbi:hypothetical protein Tco_0262025, partial [Tanacetum coccineum]
IERVRVKCCVLGTPDWTLFPNARNVNQLMNIRFPEVMPANLTDLIPYPSLEAINLIKDPLKRPTTDHPDIHLNGKKDDCFLGLTLAVNPSGSNIDMVDADADFAVRF